MTTEPCPRCGQQVMLAVNHETNRLVALEPDRVCYVHIRDLQDDDPEAAERWLVRESAGAKVRHRCPGKPVEKHREEEEALDE